MKVVMNYENNKEALAVVKQMVADGQITKEIAEKYFPELKESEESKDERIRKAIIEFFESEDDNTTYSLVPKKDILAWLEKQGEQNPIVPKFRVGDTIVAKPNLGLEDTPFVINRVEDNAYWDGDNSILVCYQDDFELVEKKPVDYDHEMWKNCEANFEGGKNEVINNPEKYGLQKQHTTTHKQEWSEEDSKNIKESACYNPKQN